jgi:threonine dehydrogenase-like Zn-dependent dehydrogenase
MRALWLENGSLSLRRDLAQPRPAVGEVLVRLLQAGICNTDIELIRGYYPFTGVLGHEFVGVVEAEGSPLHGRRVVGDINASCGRCAVCLRGDRSHCPRRTVLGIVGRDGAFADYLVLPEENLYTVPESVSTDAATFVEPLAAALEIQQQIALRPTDRVLVVGDGKLGQLIVRTLALTGCRLTVVGRHEGKLARLRRLGVEALVVDDIETGNFDLAVECTGNAAGFELARRLVRPRGTLVLKSTYADRLSLDVSALVVDEIRLVGSRCGPFAPAIGLLQRGLVTVDDLIEARYALDDGLEALARSQRRGALKVLVEMGKS